MIDNAKTIEDFEKIIVQANEGIARLKSPKIEKGQIWQIQHCDTKLLVLIVNYANDKPDGWGFIVLQDKSSPRSAATIGMSYSDSSINTRIGVAKKIAEFGGVLYANSIGGLI